MKSARQKLWPGCVLERDFGRFQTDAPAADVEKNAIVEKIISLERSMGLEVDSKNGKKLVQDTKQSLPSKSLCTFKMNNKKFGQETVF